MYAFSPRANLFAVFLHLSLAFHISQSGIDVFGHIAVSALGSPISATTAKITLARYATADTLLGIMYR